ncbi:MAG: hypothetical protein WCU00_10435 [Candidatus Latescibacterota bacterium]
MDTVYDTTVISLANGDLVGRKRGNALDKRLSALEQFLKGHRVAWYNNCLLNEYSAHILEYRNDITEIFFAMLVDRGRKAKKNTLTRHQHALLRSIRWPSHDQHLLAAALEGRSTTLFVTEVTLYNCAASVKRIFDIRVKLL